MLDPLDTLDALSSSLDDLEEVLEPLFAKTLADTEENLDAVQKAQLQVLLSYVIQDLVLIYLKSRGMDPSKHPVSEELKRVKVYFDKIAEAKNPVTRSIVVDRDAAKRFINAAISEVKASAVEAASTSTQSFPVGKHTRFGHAANHNHGPSRDEASREDVSSSSDDEENLRVIDTSDSNVKETTTNIQPSLSKAAKRRRMTDPFAGYAEAKIAARNGTLDGSDTGTQASRKRRKQQKGDSVQSSMPL